MLYADASEGHDPVLIEVDARGLDLLPDYDDIQTKLDALLDYLRGELGWQPEPGVPFAPAQQQRVQDAIDWYMEVGEQDGLGVEVASQEGSGRPMLVVEPRVGITVDDRASRLLPQLYEDMVWVDGVPTWMTSQYQHLGPIGLERIRRMWVPGKTGVAVRSYGYLVNDHDGSRVGELSHHASPQELDWLYDVLRFRERLMQPLIQAEARQWVARRGSPNRKRGLPGIIHAVQGGLTPDLIDRKRCRPRGVSPQECHCYHAAEAVYHLAGGKRSGLVPVSGKLRSGTHWWLRNRKTGEVVDPTSGQLPRGYDYGKGTPRGFLTKKPSQRAQVVIDRAKPHL